MGKRILLLGVPANIFRTLWILSICLSQVCGRCSINSDGLQLLHPHEPYGVACVFKLNITVHRQKQSTCTVSEQLSFSISDAGNRWEPVPYFDTKLQHATLTHNESADSLAGCIVLTEPYSSHPFLSLINGMKLIGITNTPVVEPLSDCFPQDNNPCHSTIILQLDSVPSITVSSFAVHDSSETSLMSEKDAIEVCCGDCDDASRTISRWILELAVSDDDWIFDVPVADSFDVRFSVKARDLDSKDVRSLYDYSSNGSSTRSFSVMHGNNLQHEQLVKASFTLQRLKVSKNEFCHLLKPHSNSIYNLLGSSEDQPDNADYCTQVEVVVDAQVTTATMKGKPISSSTTWRQIVRICKMVVANSIIQQSTTDSTANDDEFSANVKVLAELDYTFILLCCLLTVFFVALVASSLAFMIRLRCHRTTSNAVFQPVLDQES